jgi:hypothetical protein
VCQPLAYNSNQQLSQFPISNFNLVQTLVAGGAFPAQTPSLTVRMIGNELPYAFLIFVFGGFYKQPR